MKGAKRKNDGPLQLEVLTTVCVRQKGGGGGGVRGGGGLVIVIGVCSILSQNIAGHLFSAYVSHHP